MLSPDPFIQNPSNLQNYNHYSYALNNPLKYIDPSGYLHGPVAKPDGWSSSGNGAIYVNNYFQNGLRSPMEGYNLRHTYTVDSWGIVRNGMGEHVSPNEFRLNLENTGEFDNFVEQNSTRLYNNTDLGSIEISNTGFSYYTIDVSFPEVRPFIIRIVVLKNQKYDRRKQVGFYT